MATATTTLMILFILSSKNKDSTLKTISSILNTKNDQNHLILGFGNYFPGPNPNLKRQKTSYDTNRHIQERFEWFAVFY